jgi:hypothetical protein
MKVEVTIQSGKEAAVWCLGVVLLAVVVLAIEFKEPLIFMLDGFPIQ